MSYDAWLQKAHARFVPFNSSSGNWEKLREMPNDWTMDYTSKQFKLRFKLALTSFKHVGIFPEQADNWEFIYQQVKLLRKQGVERPRVLNLFAYTGGASLVAKAAGADIIHLDSVKQVVSWAKHNMELSKLNDVRWLVEDAKKFVEREIKRGRQYDGIILDPPAYGLGPSGERWKLEDHLNTMMKDVFKLLHPTKRFLVLNTYSLGFSSIIVDNLLQSLGGSQKHEYGELYLEARSGSRLPLGVFGRVKVNE
jgi:23S rRNA (cytosine1962-C5)-methyltransferase